MHNEGVTFPSVLLFTGVSPEAPGGVSAAAELGFSESWHAAPSTPVHRQLIATFKGEPGISFSRRHDHKR